MGMCQDLAQRISLTCVNDVHWHIRLHIVHEAIYENNHPVDGAAVKKLLNDDSLVSNAVSVFLKYVTAIDIQLFSECIL